jgi:hypothetical protein
MYVSQERRRKPRTGSSESCPYRPEARAEAALVLQYAAHMKPNWHMNVRSLFAGELREAAHQIINLTDCRRNRLTLLSI